MATRIDTRMALGNRSLVLTSEIGRLPHLDWRLSSLLDRGNGHRQSAVPPATSQPLTLGPAVARDGRGRCWEIK